MAKITLKDVSDTPEFAPAKCDIFPEDKFQEAKRLFARVIKQTCEDGKKKTANYLKGLIVCVDIPAAEKGKYNNALAMLANGGDCANGSGSFTVNGITGESYLFVAANGAYCIAQYDYSDGIKLSYLQIIEG